jgi:hypothetical protein
MRIDSGKRSRSWGEVRSRRDSKQEKFEVEFLVCREIRSERVSEGIRSSWACWRTRRKEAVCRSHSLTERNRSSCSGAQSFTARVKGARTSASSRFRRLAESNMLLRSAELHSQGVGCTYKKSSAFSLRLEILRAFQERRATQPGCRVPVQEK